MFGEEVFFPAEAALWAIPAEVATATKSPTDKKRRNEFKALISNIRATYKPVGRKCALAKNSYSYRKASIGFSWDARRAG